MMVDCWVCPRCFLLHGNCGAHWAHLSESPRCMRAALAPQRVAGVCGCQPAQKQCSCQYRDIGRQVAALIAP